MTLSRPIEKASFEELRHILEWMEEKNDDPNREPAVLVGGWAVYAYNPYLGSIDIDLVMSGKMRKSLCHWLKEHRGFETWHTQEVGWEGVRKRGPPGVVEGLTPYGNWIIADFASRSEEYRFEGTNHRLDFTILDGHTEVRRIDGIPVVVPERALLVLFKLKAAFDRAVRIAANEARDPRWEEYKRMKDIADVLALLDPAAAGDDLGVRFLGAKLEEFPFLVAVLRSAGTEAAAIERYGRLSAPEARGRVEDLIQVLT